MADSSPNGPSSEQATERRSVLAELPHTRPQRPSRRRESARARAKSADTRTKTAVETKTKTVRKSKSKARPKAAQEPSPQAPANTRHRTAGPKSGARSGDARSARRGVPQARDSVAGRRQQAPTQGYAAETELAEGSVSPPSGAELVGALAELAGELAQSGISAGERLLKGALSRLSGS